MCTYSAVSQTPMTPSLSAVTAGSDWNTTKITSDEALDFPWEITYGPDNFLWLTERAGEKIVRVDPNAFTTSPETMINLSAKITYSKQGGLMGMAIHPALYADITTTTNNYVFVAYTYNDGGGLKLRIARLIYDNDTNSLIEDTSLNANGTLLEGLPGSEDHNSGRMTFGPDQKLYYTIGDQGANQFTYSCNPILSQVLPLSPTDYDNYPGKTLRINTDGSIPSDNPTLNGVKSHVYSYGHRNAQGIVFSNNGVLYNSEHGAKVDDEINIVTHGKNYGWPQIAGYYDNLSYNYCNWSSLEGSCNAGDFSDHNCPSGAETATEYESYPTANDLPLNFQEPIGTYGSTAATDPPGGYLSWPTVAPSSIDIHETGNIPGWGRSLLVPTLKRGTIYRAKLTPNGDDVVGDAYEEFHSSNDRYRDIAISPDGLTIYAVTDNSGGTSGPSSGGGVSISNPGLIVKIEYVGPQVSNPPVAICQDITVTLDPDGTGTIVAADIDNNSTGGSAGLASLEISNDTFSCLDIGNSTEVTLVVTDNDGNESRCTATVTVQPNASPSPFTAPALDDVVSNCGITVEAPTLISNACSEITATTSDPVTYASGESGTITWTFDDGTNTDTTTQNVTVNALPVPTNIDVTPSATTAEVSWDNLESVTYNVRYREQGNISWVSEASFTNTITLTGLNLSTNYELQINSDCGSSQSAYSSLVNFATTNITYCASQGVTVGRISNITLSGEGATVINNDSDNNRAYTDFTSITPVLLRSDGITNYTLTVETNYNSSGVAAWIDFNQDGDFEDSGEKVWNDEGGTTSNSPRTNSFTIPTGALAGKTRMRIASRQYWTPSGSCGTIVEDNQSSEVEDYTVNIFSGLLYSGNVWSPNAPSALTSADDIFVFDGTYNVVSNINVNNVRVESGATINVNKANAISVNGNIVNNGEFILNSDSNEFASLLVEGNVLGNLKYHRFVNSNSNDNDLIAPPTTGESFVDFISVNDNIVTNPEETLYLFGPFDKSSGDYLTYSSTETANLVAGKGYRTASTNNQPFTFTGTVTTNNLNIPVANSGSIFQQWNLIGNPYTSYIKLSDFLSANMDQFETQTAGVYGYDADDSDGSNWQIWNMAYALYNPDATIVPGQGFFVSSESNGNIVFTRAMRTNNSSDDFIAGRTENTISHAVIKLNSDSKEFYTDLYVTNNASRGLDVGYDAGHFGEVSNDFAIYSELVEDNQGNDMAIQAINFNDITNNTIIPLGLNAAPGEQLTISLNATNLPFDIYLQDVTTNTFTLLNNSNYTFQPNIELNGTGRFYLRFETSVLSINESKLDHIQIYNNNSLKQVIVKGHINFETQLTLYDIQGRSISTYSIEANTQQFSFGTETLERGVYLVQLSNNTNTFTKKVIIE